MVANYAPDVGYAWWLMEHYWCLIAQALAREGRHAVLAYPVAGPVPATIQAAGIEVVTLDYADRGPQASRRLDELIDARGITGLYLTDRPYIDRRYVRFRRRGVQAIVVHDHTPGDRPAIGGPKGWLKSLARSYRPWSADLCVAVSDFVQARMIENARVARADTLVVPNGVTPYAYAPGDRDWARMEMGVDPSHVVVGMVARANRYKGIDFAIRVAGRLKPSAPPVVFAFVGDGPDLDAFRAQAATHGVADRFRFLGRRSDARRLMAGFDIGLHPSRGEVGYCLAILEMMNAALPVVVPDRPSVRGATTDGVTGAWYAADSEEACAAALGRLAGSADARRVLGEAARHESMTRFSLAHADRAFLDGVAARL